MFVCVSLFKWLNYLQITTTVYGHDHYNNRDVCDYAIKRDIIIQEEYI